MKHFASQLVAHRGHQSAFPENSLLAIMDAIRLGAKYIEFDIQLIKDAVAVLYHDVDMQRLSGRSQSILSLNSTELPDYCVSEPGRLGDQFSDNPINLLSELVFVVTDHPEIHFYMEVKEESLEALGIDQCIASLKQCWGSIPANLSFISFDMAAVAAAKQQGFSQTALVIRDWSQRHQLLQESGADCLFINYERILLMKA